MSTVGTNEKLPMVAKVHRELRQLVLGGTYPAHTYLPAERELARNLGTSRVTISRALDALQRDGLVVRSQGRGTRVLPDVERQSQTAIAVVHGDVSGAARADSLKTLRGATDMLKQLGRKQELILLSDETQFRAKDIISRFGAMLAIADVAQKDVMELQARQFPVVFAKLEEDWDVSATWVDHETPIHQAVRMLVSFGHERIAFVGREPSYGFYGRARAGYIAGLREASLPIDETLIAECEKTDALSGYLAVRPLLSQPNPPTAIVAARDSIAEGVCRAIEKAKLTIGRDVSVVGFDDTTWPEGRSFLTSFREPCYEMGAAAAEMLVERLDSGPKPNERRRFDAALVLRRSAGPCIRENSLLEPTGRGDGAV